MRAGGTDARDDERGVVGRIAIEVSIWLIMYFCLADPDGRIDDRAARLLLGLAAVGFTGLLTANLLLTGVSPIAGPFVRCAHERCPPNPLSVLNLSGAGRALSSALGLWTAMTVAGTA